MSSSVHPDALRSLVEGTHGAPFEVLGPHAVADGQVIIRTFQPRASEVSVVIEATGVWAAMTRIDDGGVWEVTVPGADAGVRYHLAVKDYYGETITVQDPYRFPAQLTDFDRYLLAEGRHLYRKGVTFTAMKSWGRTARRLMASPGYSSPCGHRTPGASA